MEGLARIFSTVTFSLDAAGDLSRCFDCLSSKAIFNTLGQFFGREVLIRNRFGSSICICDHGAPEVLTTRVFIVSRGLDSGDKGLLRCLMCTRKLHRAIQLGVGFVGEGGGLTLQRTGQ